jgi:transcriptional repressor NrdR
LKCPTCGFSEDKVIDSRPVREGSAIRRRRECNDCQCRFTTYEFIEDTQISVVKSMGRREVFSREKLLRGIKTALIKRDHAEDLFKELIKRIERSIYNMAGTTGEILSQEIGEIVLRELRTFDEVGYIRFASVYRRFQDTKEFINELQDLN